MAILKKRTERISDSAQKHVGKMLNLVERQRKVYLFEVAIPELMNKFKLSLEEATAAIADAYSAVLSAPETAHEDC